MNPRELVDYIRSGPSKIELNEPLRFRRRTRSNPCDFIEFIQALQSNETIQTAMCESHQELDISEDEWVILIKTLGRIKGIDDLTLYGYCTPSSRDFRPFQVFASAVGTAQSLIKVRLVVGGESFSNDSSGITALASALRAQTGLQEFRLLDWSETVEGTALDPVLRALLACFHLQRVIIMTRCASASAIKRVLQLPKGASLHLETDHWLVVADEIRHGRCNIKHLHVHKLRRSSSEDTEVVKAIASAIRLDSNLESLEIHLENNFTDEAGVVLAEALTVNKTLRKITLSVELERHGGQVQETMGAPLYEAFCTMLRVNSNIFVNLPEFETAGADKRLRQAHRQMIIEQVLNYAGRGRLLSSSRTTRKEWVDALNKLNSFVHESPEFTVNFLYSLLRLNPSLCLLDLNDTTNAGL
jgi:hypothetical protein